MPPTDVNPKNCENAKSRGGGGGGQGGCKTRIEVIVKLKKCRGSVWGGEGRFAGVR